VRNFYSEKVFQNRSTQLQGYISTGVQNFHNFVSSILKKPCYLIWNKWWKNWHFGSTSVSTSVTSCR